jgi:transposase-like protein
MLFSEVSARTLELLVERLLSRTLSRSEVITANKELTVAVEVWRPRDLAGLAIKYLYLERVDLAMRMQRTIETVPVLVAIGVMGKGSSRWWACKRGGKEVSGSWQAFFQDLNGFVVQPGGSWMACLA